MEINYSNIVLNKIGVCDVTFRVYDGSIQGRAHKFFFFFFFQHIHIPQCVQIIAFIRPRVFNATFM